MHRRRARHRASTSASASARCSAATRRSSRSRPRRSSTPSCARGWARRRWRSRAPAGYVNAGTVEFIADARRPVELLLPRDERAAAGRAPGHRGWSPASTSSSCSCASRRASRSRSSRTTSRLDGHAIEARRLRRGPGHGFLPVGRARCAGYREPRGRAGRRRRRAPASVVGTDYDPMLAKVIAHGPDRADGAGAAGPRARRAARARRRRRTPRSCARCSRRRRRARGRARHRPDRAPRRRGRAAAARATSPRAALAALPAAPPTTTRATRRDGWRLGGARAPAHVAARGRRAARRRGRVAVGRIARAASALRVALRRRRRARYGVRARRRRASGSSTRRPRPGGAPRRARRGAAADGPGSLRGADARRRCCSSTSRVGDAVERGRRLVVLESMKMELSLTAPARRDGRRAATSRSATSVARGQPSRWWRVSTLRDHADPARRVRAPTRPTPRAARRPAARGSSARALGGGERARERHTARGKLLPRERVERLLRPGRAVPRALAAGRRGPLRRRRAGRGDRHRRRPRRRAASASSSPTTRPSRAAPTTR